jgi:uncharacterized protein YndB with AHSA1/START domain
MTTTDDASPVVVVRRILSAPRDRVFAAWLDPESLAQWMCPGDVIGADAEVDPRVGGRFRIAMRRERGSVEHHGEYLAIDPPSLLSFTWISINTDNRPSIVTIEFLDRGDRTELVLTHRGLPPARADSHRNGWTTIVGKLDAVLRGGAA